MLYLPACLHDACSQKRDTGCVCAHAVTAQAEAAYTACLSHRHKHGAARLALARLALGNGQVCTDMYRHVCWQRLLVWKDMQNRCTRVSRTSTCGPVHALATWCLSQVDACQQHASLLLEDQPDNEDAAIMLAEIMAHQV